MSYIYEKIMTYSVAFYGGPAGDPDEGHDSFGADAVIQLHLEKSEAYLTFYREGTTIPPHRATILKGPDPHSSYTVTYPWSHFASIVDMLRNEKPVRLFFQERPHHESGHVAYISTRLEPVGEGET